MKNSTLLKSTAAIAFVVAGAAGAMWAHDSFAQSPLAAMHGARHDGSHLALMAERISAAANATPEQKARIDALVAQATTDLKALHTQAAQDHQQVHAVLTQDVVDRAALENLRIAHMQAADQGSRRLTQLIGDVAEVLTAEQRRAVISRMQMLHGPQ